MNSHLAVRIDGHFAALPEDAAIDIEDSNPYFNDTPETWSYSFDVPIEGNRHILGNIDDVHSDMRLVSMENKSMQVFAEGVEFRGGKVATTEDQEIKDSVSLSMTSTYKQLADLYGDMTLQDIIFPESDRESLQIGEGIGEVLVKGDSQYRVSIHGEFNLNSVEKKITNVKYLNPTPLNVARLAIIWYGGKPSKIDMNLWADNSQSINDARIVYPQALGFSVPREYAIDPSPDRKYRYQVALDGNGDPKVNKDFINTSTPYGASIIQPDGSTRQALYFNSRVCYTHHSIDSDGNADDGVVYDKNGYGPYFVLDADRPQSGICFYVLYVIRALFHHLGVTYDAEQEAVLTSVSDLCRLGFYTTKCKYNIISTVYPSAIGDFDADFSYASDFDANYVNQWLQERGTNGYLEPSKSKSSNNEENRSVTISYYYRWEYNPKTKDYEPVQDPRYMRTALATKMSTLPLEFYDPTSGELTIYDFTIKSITASQSKSTFRYSARISRMYANAYNLPEMQVSSFIDSLWAAFGIKFDYNAQTNVVTPRFIRDIMRDMLRDKRDPIVMPGEAWEISRSSEKITGFRQHYSAESDRKSQMELIRKKTTDYNTYYDYRVEQSTHIETITDYYSFSQNRLNFSVGNSTCYVDVTTGNAYRIKISKEALDNGDYNALQPSLFEVAQWHGVEIGDCTDGNQDYIIEVSIDFEPLYQNDLNWSLGIRSAKLCPFVDDTMWSEKVDMSKKGRISNVVESDPASTYCIDEILLTDEKYDPKGTDDANSPLQSHDWGNAICMMRGGGANARLDYYDHDYDGFGSYKIRSLTGDYAMDSDSVSIYGDEYDYNGGGSDNGIGVGERFSLKLRAYHTDPKTGAILCTNPAIARRGLHDRFMADYAYFVLHRKKITVSGRVNVIDIRNIQWDRRYSIGGVTGWINKISTHISLANGIEKCEFEMWIL